MGGIGLKELKIPTKLKQTTGNDMKSIFQTLALACALSSSVMAADTTGALRPFVGIGYSWGGDTILPVTLVTIGTGTRYREDVSAGAGLDLRAGLDYRLSGAPVSVQASIGQHNDEVNGLEGETAKFRRNPIELLAYWHGTPSTRVGFGVRRATRATYSLYGGSVSTPLKTHFKASTGIVLEGEYFIAPSWSVKARYVHETFRSTDATPELRFDGSHLGLLTQFYFN